VAVLEPGKPAPPTHAEGYSTAAVATVTTENEHLRDILTEHDHEKALAANKALREPVEKQVAEIRGLEFKEPIGYQVLNRKQIKQTMAGKMAEVFSEKEFRQMADAMAAIGLLPAHYPLREKYIDLLSEQVAAFYDQHQHKEVETPDWLPSGKVTVGVTAGASCPNNLIEDTIRRLFELRGISVQRLLAN